MNAFPRTDFVLPYFWIIQDRSAKHKFIGKEITVDMDWNLDSLKCYMFFDFMQLFVDGNSNFLFHHQQVTWEIV